MSDDPFAEPTDNDRTVIRPRPGGKASNQPPPQARPAAAPVAATGPVPTVGANRLLAAAAPLLAAVIRIAGGREVNLRSLQAMGLYPANSLFVSDYLTTKGQPAEEDYRMVADLGFEIVVGDASRSDAPIART